MTKQRKSGRTLTMKGKGGEGDVMVASSPPPPPPPPPPNPEKKDHYGPQYTPDEIRRALAETKTYLDDYVYMLNASDADRAAYPATSKNQADRWLKSILRGEENGYEDKYNPYVTPTLRTVVIPQLPLPVFREGSQAYNVDLMDAWMTQALYILDDAEEALENRGSGRKKFNRMTDRYYFPG